MASVPSGTIKFEIGRVIGETFSGLKRNWQVLTMVSVGVAVIGAILNVIMMRSLLDATTLQANPAALITSPGYWGALLAGIALNGFAMSALLSVLLKRDGAQLQDAVAAGLRFFLPMLGLTLLWTLGVTFASMLLLVPGIILLTMWSVSAPVLLAEQTGVIAAFGRSRALTKGIRWPVFGALLVFVIILYVIVFAIQGLGGGSMAVLNPNITVAFVIAAVTSFLSTLFVSSFLAALYLEVVNAKEGGSRSELAEVFS